MEEEQPIIHDHYQLQKYPGKGGWTYAKLPHVPREEKRAFGMLRVKGTIDGYPIKQYNLMPMGDGVLFLPVKAEIRKKIRKKEGDWVEIVLFRDNDPLEIPPDLQACFDDEPEIMRIFFSFTQAQQKHYVDWINEAKQVETKANRIAKTLDRVARGLLMYDPVR